MDAKFALARAPGDTEKTFHNSQVTLSRRLLARRNSNSRTRGLAYETSDTGPQVLLAAAIAAVVYYYPRFAAKPVPANELTLSGNIEAHESLISFKVPGRIVELPVEEGQLIAQGAMLARLEDADYKQRIRVDEASVGVRQSNWR